MSKLSSKLFFFVFSLFTTHAATLTRWAVQKTSCTTQLAPASTGHTVVPTSLTATWSSYEARNIGSSCPKMRFSARHQKSFAESKPSWLSSIGDVRQYDERHPVVPSKVFAPEISYTCIVINRSLL